MSTSEVSSKFGIFQEGISKVLSGYWLQVPPNQREYSWTDEVERLFNDFSNAINRQGESYFLGSLVTVESAPSRLEVVDGQQRLATTAILLAAMREHLLDRDRMIAKSIERTLCDIDRKNREYLMRLQLNTDDNAYFQGAILALDPSSSDIKPSRPSHHNLKAAKECAREHVKSIVSGLKDSDHGDEIDRWLTFLEHKAIVILLVAPDNANAYKMFETLNDRGLQTTQSDLIKNYLFSEASGSKLNEAQAKWSKLRGVLETLGEDSITLTFLRQAAISFYGHMTRDELFSRIEKRVRGPRKALRLLEELEGAAYDYVSILNPASEKWNTYPASTRRAIEALNLLSVKPMRPLMLAVARKFNPKEADKAYRRMITWKVRFLIVGGARGQKVEKDLAKAAHRITEGEITSAAKLVASLRKTVPTDSQFQQAFAGANVSRGPLARYYLRSLEQVESGEAEPCFIPNDDQNVVNLEHVLPLSSSDNWPDWPEETVRTYRRRLGNQCLLRASRNKKLKNASWEDKRPVLASSPFALTKEIGESDAWTAADIKARQERLAELALRAWQL